MHVRTFTRAASDYIRQHWYKIGLVLLLLFVLMKKDLTFNINLRTPARALPEQLPPPTQKAKKDKSQERLTDQTSRESLLTESPQADLFDLSAFSRKNRQPKAMEQLAKVGEEAVIAYLKRFARVATHESDKFGIPASVILANALLHSYAGHSELAKAGNNHFALPCTSDWQGNTGEHANHCYRYYENAWTSFRDHSMYLTTGAMAANTKKLNRNDYKAWAKAIEKNGFSQEKNLTKQLITLIEQYNLTQLDE